MEQSNNIVKKSIFNPNGDDSLLARKIIGGNSTNLFNLNNVKYTWAKNMYRVMMANFWIPEKVDLSNDIKDFNNLSDKEKIIYKSILSFLTFLDSIQTNNLPKISDYITASEITTLLGIQAYQEIVHCYAEGTEILTTSGWKDFKNLNANDKVAQYHNDGSIDFVIPSKIISSKHTGNMVHISNGTYNTLVTPNHRVVYNDCYTNTVSVKEASTISLNNHTIPVAGRGVGSISSLSVRDKLKIAYQANGIVLNKGNISEDGICYRFYMMTERKINRLILVCEENNIRYTVKESKPKGYVSIYIWFPELFTKDFNEYDLSQYSMSWCREFIDEASIYDGTPSNQGRGNLRYFNTNREAIDKMMAIGTLANYRINFYVGDGKNGFGTNAENPKECFYLNFVDKSYVTGKDLNKEYIDYNGSIYCVTVPSGMIVVRYDDRVTVSGNSQSYAYIIESIIPSDERDSVYENWRVNEVLFNRNKYIAGIYQEFWDNSPTLDNPFTESFAKVLIANYILESVYFYNGFIFFYNLASRNQMLGTADEIRYINRDEECFIEGTEVLTSDGFQDFRDITFNSLIGQYNMDTKEIDFVNPLFIIDKEYSGNMNRIYNKKGSYETVVTENHDLVVKHKKTNKINKIKAKDLKFNFIYDIPVSGFKCGSSRKFDCLDQLLIATQSDGSIDKERTGKFTNYQVIHFGLKEDRKIQRLISILDKCKEFGVTYDIHNSSTEYTNFYIHYPNSLPLILDKEFNWVNLQDIDFNYGIKFLNELQHWDGHVNDESNYIYFSNTNEKAIDKIQAIASLSGVRVTRSIQIDERKESYKDVHRLYIYLDNYVQPSQDLMREVFEYTGKVYCVTVPTGSIIVRYKGNVTVSGNCHVDLFANMIKEINNLYPNYITQELIHSMFDEACKEEINWMNYILTDADILGMDNVTTEKYTKYLINRRIVNLGFEPLYLDYNENPYSYLEMQSDSDGGDIKGNFFESSVTSYSQTSAIDGWDLI